MKWRSRSSPALNVRTGWFQVNPNLGGNIERNAFRPFVSGTTGSLIPRKMTWTPDKGGASPGRVQVRRLLRHLAGGPARGLDTSPTTGRHGAYVLAEQRLPAKPATRSAG